MGIQFRLGPGDHKPVEDFLSRDHAGTTAITLDTNATRHQHDADLTPALYQELRAHVAGQLGAEKDAAVPWSS